MIGVILDLNSVLNSQALGYIGAFTAAILFGSNYVVTKKFPLGDGFAFQWFMSMGIMMVGYVCLILSGDPIWVYSGLLGGALWAMGNALVPTAIRLVGLGISFLLWSIVSLLIGWCSGKFGLFGLQSEEVSLPLLNDLGPIFGIASMVVYVFIKPTLEDEKVNKDVMVVSEYSDNENDDQDPINKHYLKGKEINDSDRDDQRFGSSEFPSSFFSASPHSFYSLYGRRMIGAGMALAAGGMYGFCLVPFQLWYQQQNSSDMFVISHYSGIFITSTIIFIGYSIVKRNKPEIFSVSIIPAMISGGMWGIAQASWLITNATLGFVIGYPIVVVGPMIINSLWAVILFKEIRGKKNLGLLGFALSLNIMCVICTVISSIDFSKYTS